MDNEIDILPNVMIGDSVVLEALLCVPVERLSIDAANEAHILAIIIGLTLLISQLRKCIDNDTKDDVQQDCDDEQEEGQVVCGSEVETLKVLGCGSLCWQKLADTATTTKTIVDSG
jgi:hypothetical protein